MNKQHPHWFDITVLQHATKIEFTWKIVVPLSEAGEEDPQLEIDAVRTDSNSQGATRLWLDVRGNLFVNYA